MKKYNLNQTYRFGTKLASVLAESVYESDFTGNEEAETNIYCIDACKNSSDQRRTSSGEMYAIVEYCRNHPNEDIAILTPYKLQVKLLRDELYRNGMDQNIVYTIHGSQGREWDTILFSAVDTHDMWFVDSNNAVSRGRNLVNTAVSRAKKKLIIVADKRYWINQEGQLIEKLISVAETI